MKNDGDFFATVCFQGNDGGGGVNVYAVMNSIFYLVNDVNTTLIKKSVYLVNNESNWN